jgi:hypothetical protein
MGGTCGTARLRKKRNAGRNLVKKPEGKSPLDILVPGRRGEVNVKINLKNKCDGKAWPSIHLAQDRSQWRAV